MKKSSNYPSAEDVSEENMSCFGQSCKDAWRDEHDAKSLRYVTIQENNATMTRWMWVVNGGFLDFGVAYFIDALWGNGTDEHNTSISIGTSGIGDGEKLKYFLGLSEFRSTKTKVRIDTSGHEKA